MRKRTHRGATTNMDLKQQRKKTDTIKSLASFYSHLTHGHLINAHTSLPANDCDNKQNGVQRALNESNKNSNFLIYTFYLSYRFCANNII